MLDIVKNDGIELIEIDKYIEAYMNARHTWDQGFMNKEKTLHFIDIFDNFLNDYKNENIITLRLSLEEEELFRYNPRALSTKVFGTPDFWTIIMRLNQYTHPAEMDFVKPVRVPRVEKFEQFYSHLHKIKENLGGNINDVFTSKY